MKLTLGRWPYRKTYPLDTSLAALLRYRSAFGASFFKDFLSPDSGYLYLVRLVWAAIEGDKPDFPEFLRAVSRSKGFAETAKAVQSHVLMTAGKSRAAGKDAADDFDELDILAMMAVSGISMDLARELPAFLILDVISKRTAIMRGDKSDKSSPARYHKMTGREMRGLYGG